MQVPQIVLKNVSRDFSLITGKTLLEKWLRPQIQLIKSVQDLSFEIFEGEQLALLGPNGSGKSTTLKMLAGILEPTSGDISVLNQTPHEDPSGLSRNLAVFFGTRSALWSQLPIRDSFEYVKVIYDLDQKTFSKRKNELVGFFQLEDFLDRKPNTLSLGQRMRCELVRKLLPHPSIIMLDEPTIGMDLISKNQFRNLIRQYTASNKVTLILTSHDSSDILDLCQRVVVLNKGRKVFDGSTHDLKELHSNGDFEKALVNLFQRPNGEDL